jgi:hypothetical protein
MKKILASLSILVLALALPAAAQMAPKSIARVIEVKVKGGMHQQFEDGMKKLHQWQHEHNYPFASHTWSIITGDRGGHYVIVVGGHDWKDFDEVEKFGPAISKEVDADVAPYVETAVFSYWRELPDLSPNPPQAGQAPPKYISVTTYFLKPGGEDNLEDVIKQAKAAIEKTHWPANPDEWDTLVNGGEGSQIVHVIAHNDWADFQPPEPTFAKMLSSVYGKEGSQALFNKFVKSVRSWRTEIYRFRPELSYKP